MERPSKNILFLILIFSCFGCGKSEFPTVFYGTVLDWDTGLPKTDVSVRIFGIKENFMRGNNYITTHTVSVNAKGEFELSVSHPEVSYFTVLVWDSSANEYFEATSVDCSPHSCLDLPAGRRYELEIRVVE